MWVHESIIEGAIGLVFLVAVVTADTEHLWEALIVSVGLVSTMLGAIIRKLFVSKADRAEVTVLAESIKTLKESKVRDHEEILRHLHENQEANRQSLDALRESLKEINATMRLMMQRLFYKQGGGVPD